MNDKLIAELAHKANMTVFPSGLKEFAELIVRECAEVAADLDALDIYEEIREHCGVSDV